LDKLDVELVNAVKEDGLALEEHQAPTNGQDGGEVEFPHYEDSDGEPEEDVWSLNDWCSRVGADEESDDEDERVVLVWSSAICLLPEDECPIAESLKVSKLDDGQVAYRLRGTKDLGQLWVKDGPRRDFKSLGVIEGYMWINGHKCYKTVRTPTLCKPDTSDRPYCFLFNLLNLATPLLSYAVRLVLLIFVLLSSLPCYLYDAVLILTSDILYSLIDTFLSILRYISTHVFVVEP
jgi:hypothetical protein